MVMSKLDVALLALKEISENIHTLDDTTYCSIAEEALCKIENNKYFTVKLSEKKWSLIIRRLKVGEEQDKKVIASIGNQIERQDK